MADSSPTLLPFSAPTSRVPFEDGRWGEHTEGSGVDIEFAQDEFQELRRELSRVSVAASSRLSHSISAADPEKGVIFEDNGFDLEQWVRNDTEKDRQHGVSPKRIGVSFQNLSISGVGSGTNFVETFPESVINNLGRNFFRSVRNLVPAFRPHVPTKIILKDFTGLVRAGEMMLVLGSPGSGTTTLLKALTNQRQGYVSITGDVLYDGIDHVEAKKLYQGEIIFNEEDDRHISTLTVAQTLRFALGLKTPRVRSADESRSQFVEKLRDLYGKMFGIEHTMNTLVGGDSKARGVSGGERKRVSIAEVLANRAAIVAFDNSTRGLDASTAVDYIRSLRILTNLTHSTTIVTLYQAGEGIYKEFDKVCLIDSGRQIFYGPATEARSYFESLGFVAPARITTADFLTSITHPKERIIKPGYEQTTPQTPEALETAFKSSEYYKKALQEVLEYDIDLKNTGHASIQQFSQAVASQKSKISSSKSPYTVSFFRQVDLLVRRELQLQWQDQVTLRTKIINSIVVGFIFGSLFYNIPNNTSGAFSRGGILFFSLVFNGWLLQVESGNVIADRPLMNKHRRFGMYRPSALSVAKTISDLPIFVFQIFLFLIITYFLSNLARTASQFFIHVLIIITATVTMMSFYRSLAAFSDDMHACLRLVAAVLNAIAFWTGYVSPARSMPWWYRWVYYCNPLTYAFEALMGNEFHRRQMDCASDQLLPNIAGAFISNQACSLPGALPGSSIVSGDDYIESQFGYKRSHLWRNFGILIGFFLLFLGIQIVFSELLTYDSASGQVKQFVRTKMSVKNPKGDTKKNDKEDYLSEDIKIGEDGKGSLFTFQNVNYVIPTPDGERTLLDDIEGYAVPGKLLALMGSSGAGKTTLLNAVSQRLRFGRVTGEFNLNGHGLNSAFQRKTGFVEQQDLHEPKQTVREALRFSARLRQPASVPLDEKYEYVEKVIKLLDLDSITDALVDDVGSGLSVEERKRVTIGVELASKPRILFLDEPTSGLDSEGAYSIVTFLKKLAANSNFGIICTIHQPSSILFSQFDSLLLLARGGKTVYFGPIGNNGETVIDYFSRVVRPPEPDSNPAEYILEAVGAGATRKSTINWPDLWKRSIEIIERKNEIAALNQKWRVITTSTSDLDDRNAEYSSPLNEQIKAVTVRLWLTLWRTPSYGFSIVFSSIAAGLTAGILFFQANNSIFGMQSRTFLTFFVLLEIIPIVNSLEIHFIIARDLYDLRERNAKVYSWVALVTAYLVCPLPYMVLTSVLFFPIFWYMPGLYMSPHIAGYGYFMILLMQIWHSHLAVLLGSFVPSITAVGIINPFFFVITQATVGITIPYASLNGFYKYFIYWVNPISWAIRGLVVTAEHEVPVACSSKELVVFEPPSGLTCETYAGEWVVSDTVGQLLNPFDSSSCKFCEYTVGDDYLESIGFSYNKRWRDIGVFIMFVFVNAFLPFLVYYFARVISWKRFSRLFKKV
ncbi:ABC-2 type transporter-domain-containing protein [Lipomyces japonicus]|uniref:ABC-2 type transporter-domain-containing protein n=1 Tax=Lipomyces japonicus TaxID=56871 RepID=UPI0034D009DC